MYCAPNNSPTPKLGEGSGEIPGRVSAVQEHGDVEGLGEAELQLEVLLLRLDLAELRMHRGYTFNQANYDQVHTQSQNHEDELTLSTNSMQPSVVVHLQGSAIRLLPGLLNFVTAVAYTFCLSLPLSFTQPGRSLLTDPCTM